MARAKAKSNGAFEQARSSGSRRIRHDGRKRVLFVSIEEWEVEVKNVGALTEFLTRSPLRASGLEVKRLKDRFRSPDL